MDVIMYSATNKPKVNMKFRFVNVEITYVMKGSLPGNCP